MQMNVDKVCTMYCAVAL